MTGLASERPVPGAPDFRFEEHECTGSTNTVCFDRARAGHSGNLWIKTTVQTDGRGRRGRDWESLAGNLFASLLLVNPKPEARIGELPLVAAVALAEAVDKAAGTLQLVGLKWPNDLLIDGAKLSGILLEAEHLNENRRAVVIGFGVNCVSHPPLSLYRATDLKSLGYRVTAAQLFEALAAVLSEKLAEWQQPDGFRSIRSEWLKRAVNLDRKITVRTDREEITGTFADLDAQGHLVLTDEAGNRRTIYAGDVFFSCN